MKKIILSLLILCIAPALFAEAPIPAEAEAEVVPDPNPSRQQYFGKQIFKQDWMRWQATQLLLEKNVLQTEKNATDVIVDITSGSRAVHFMGMTDKGPKIFQSVLFDKDGQLTHQAGIKTQEHHQQMFRATVNAKNVVDKKCSQRFKTTIFPTSEGWVVIALAEANEPGNIIIAGHQRVFTDKQGENVLKTEQVFAGDCLEKAPGKLVEGKKSAGLYVVDKENVEPTEVMVYLNLVTQVPLSVVTVKNGIPWHIENGLIDTLDVKNLHKLDGITTMTAEEFEQYKKAKSSEP